MLLINTGIAVVAAPSSATFNPSDNNGLALSNGNLTVTCGSGGGGNRATNSKSSGKFYWEYLPNNLAGAGAQVGIATSGWDLTNSMLNTANGAIVRTGDGLAGFNGNNFGSGMTFANGTTSRFALDMGNLKIWFAENSGNWNNSGTDNPATNTGGLSISGISTPVFACVQFGGTAGQSITANFSSASWAFSAPSGFGQL